MLERGTVHAGGFSTAYVAGGSPGRPAVVFVHDGGFGTTGELCWGPVMELLADRYHVVAPDLLGWGGTDKAVFLDRSPYAARIPHVAAFCAALGLGSPAFVGTSFGGSLTLRALIGEGNPWNARAGISISGSGGPWHLRTDELSDYVPSEAAARRLTEMLVADMAGLDDHVRQRHENSLIPGHWEALAAPRLANPSRGPRPAVHDPLLDQVAELDIPLLLVEGEKDTLLEQGWAERLAGDNPRIAVEITPHAHEPNIDAPEETADLVGRFLARTEETRA